MNEFIKEIHFDEKGLIPAVAFDVTSNEVVMLAYMNRESVEKTLATGYCTYYSRSRQKLWQKGESSGHFQRLKAMKLDCDGDTLLLEIEQIGAACHTGSFSCFFRQLQDGAWVAAAADTGIGRGMALEYAIVKERAEHPVEGSYTNYLLREGVDKICKKIGEESTECVIAAKNRSREELTYEAADLLYHLTVLLYEQGLNWDDIGKAMLNRQKK